MLTAAKRVGADPTRSALWPAAEKFVAFLSQIPPRGPFLPVVPVYNNCAVNNLRFWALHGMEEVVGSIPTRSTNNSFKINQLPSLPFSVVADLVAFGSKFPATLIGRCVLLFLSFLFSFLRSSRLMASTVSATPSGISCM